MYTELDSLHTSSGYEVQDVEEQDDVLDHEVREEKELVIEYYWIDNVHLVRRV